MELFGYELLCRKSLDNRYEGADDDKATASVLDNFFTFGFFRLIDGTRGFVNFSENLLINGAPKLLPPEKLVVEVLEKTKVDDDVIRACRSLKDNGYMIALDDFAVGLGAGHLRLLDIADIVKINCPKAHDPELKSFLRRHGKNIAFLAEKVETAADYKLAREMGFELFQGYLFSRPTVINAKAIGMLNNSLIPILNELKRPEPDFGVIAEYFKHDLELSYKLLRLVNSVYYGARYIVKSINDALVRLGTLELTRWVNLMLLKGMINPENAELIKTCLVRGKMLALLSELIGDRHRETDYFMTGIFSSIDSLLGESMDEIVKRLPFSDSVRGALTGEDNFLRRPLDAVLSYENAQWDAVDAYLSETGLGRDIFISLYLDALEWQQTSMAA